MQTPQDPTPDVSPVANNRQHRLRTASVALAATGVLVGIAYAIRSRSPELTTGQFALADVLALGQRAEGHPKMQAFGRNWSEHRLIHIDPYFRRAA